MVNNDQDGKEQPLKVELDIMHVLEQLGLNSKLAMQQVFNDSSSPPECEENKK
ncbi:hypothetical protein ACLBWT_20090 [Paenibacillus sp. D51F]